MAVLSDFDAYPMGTIWEDSLSTAEKNEYVNLALAQTAELGYTSLADFTGNIETGLMATYLKFLADRNASTTQDDSGLEMPSYVRNGFKSIRKGTTDEGISPFKIRYTDLPTERGPQ